MLIVWIPLRFQQLENYSKTSISMKHVIFILLFRLTCWESQAFLPMKRKSCLLSASERDCVITASCLRYWILWFRIDLGPFTRCKPFHFDSQRRMLVPWCPFEDCGWHFALNMASSSKFTPLEKGQNSHKWPLAHIFPILHHISKQSSSSTPLILNTHTVLTWQIATEPTSGRYLVSKWKGTTSKQDTCSGLVFACLHSVVC